jgi:hypothetical protein
MQLDKKHPLTPQRLFYAHWQEDFGLSALAPLQLGMTRKVQLCIRQPLQGWELRIDDWELLYEQVATSSAAHYDGAALEQLAHEDALQFAVSYRHLPSNLWYGAGAGRVGRGKLSKGAWMRLGETLFHYCKEVQVQNVRLWWDQALAVKRPENEEPGMWTMYGLVPYDARGLR